MSSAMALVKTNYSRHQLKKRTVFCFEFLNKIAKHFKVRNSIRVLLFILIACAIAFYLFQINHLSVQGFEISKLETNLEALRATNEGLKLETTRLQSINNFQVASSQLKMVKIDQADYISAAPNTVAAK